MLADAPAVLRALRLPPDSEVEVEPQRPGVERWTICPPAEGPRVVVVRGHPDGDHAANHAAVVEALARTGFSSMPRPLTALGEIVVEEPVAGMSALSLLPPARSGEAAVAALAALHQIELREGTGWGSRPEERMPSEFPLHRLGFAAHEREAAAAALESAREAVLKSPWGFVHGDATAANVLLAPDRAWLVNFHAAGFGPQLYDVAAFLLTAGFEGGARRELARSYAARRSLRDAATADLVDLAGILWGIGELLVLPRRSIELLGDDAATAALNTSATRIERGIREPAGSHPAASAIRAALWPG